MQDTRLDNRHVIVTGGARGIGKGIAQRTSEAGADVTIFDVNMEEAAKTKDLLEDNGGRAQVIEVDVSDADMISDGLERAVQRFGHVHGLVNNAGIQRSIPILELTEKEWAQHMAINLKGVFLCCRAVGTHMLDNEIKGAIVNIASTGAERPFPGQGVYASTKAGVVAFTMVLAKELGDYEITANCINPGTVDTPMVQKWLKENARQTGLSQNEVLQNALDFHILSRMGKPREIGHVATLLLSHEGNWITGESFNIDGGYTKM
jgi:NAD(P)-dependent dehydrogenase (short-subunit alcohol dehydrogenase family)